ncbi:MAG TPA: hypothetical protein VND93_18090 [Myxococcales bacterium]|jgi:hypothetical protein|nr:hypothetical protein [Myxococcales bacterium]
MASRITDARLDTFDAGWRAGWRGDRRLVMLTSSLADPSRFVAYGTDGYIAFRVEGGWRADLTAFLSRMDADGAELLPPPHVALARPATEQLTFPDSHTVQRCFDRVLFGHAAGRGGAPAVALGGS